VAFGRVGSEIVSDLVRGCAFAVIGLLGLFCGVAGVVVSRLSVSIGAVPVPYGLVLALAAAATLFREARRACGFGGAVAGVAGWAVPVLAAAWPRPEGDVLIGGDGTGIAFVLLGIVAAGWHVSRSRHDDQPRSVR
jgi:Family of unknown function (DUF6113)